MRIEYTGRQTEVPEAARKLAERRLGKLAKLLRGITRVHVILTCDKHRQAAEVSVHSPHVDISATEVSNDLGSSLAAAFTKLERQAERHMGRMRKRRAPSSRSWTFARPAEGEPRLIRTRRGTLKPMTVEEAILEERLNEEGLVVFRDATTERVTVLYRRKDGNLGLIEPEA